MLQNTDTAPGSSLVAAAEDVDASRALNVNESVPVKFAAGV